MNMKNGTLLLTVLKIVVMVFSFADNSLELLNGGMKIDIMKMFIGLLIASAIFLYARKSEQQKNKLWRFFAMCLAVFTVFGRSYATYGNWDGIFGSGIQFLLACFVMLGHYWWYKNIYVCILELLKSRKNFLRRNPCNCVEKYLFDKHCFVLPLAVLIVLALPYYIGFLPGTIHADAVTQLYQHFGYIKMSGNHPVLVTKVIGICVEIGKKFFQSDNIGLAIYTTGQLTCQLLIFAYGIWVFCKLEVPMFFRWAALFIYGVFPLFPMYGMTISKDTGYYECTLLFVLSLIHLCSGEIKASWWNRVLLILGAVGICVFRKEGKYLVILVLLAMLLVYRTHIKVFVTGMIACIAMVVLIEGVYIPSKGIEPGRVEEMLSIPLQQTARYIREHYDEISDDEKAELQKFFVEDIAIIGDVYRPEISDPVKGRAVFTGENGGAKEYLALWLRQGLVHPDTYLQALIHHVYRYFLPGKECWEGENDVVYYYSLVGHDKWETEFLNIQFVMENGFLRNLLQQYATIFEKIPFLALLYSPGFYTYLLFFMVGYLVDAGKFKEMVILLPVVVTFLGCLMSPVNGYLRYMFPIVAIILPYLVWCYVKGHREILTSE